jgi:TPR repeat protein
MRRLEANPSDAPAMTLLGELFNQGLGVAQDPTKAAEWYRLAAQQGDPHALSSLGLMAIDGRGMEKNPAQGLAWLEQAAAKGDPSASHNLALLLMGSGTPENLLRAVELLRKAAESEIGDAQHALGVLYLRGRGVSRDAAEAARWFERAARNGNVAGLVEQAILLFNGEGVAPDEAQAARLFRRAALRGNPIAQNRLARLLVAGRGVPQNRVEAAAWHLLAAARGLTDPWLDDVLRSLSADERTRAERLARERLRRAVAVRRRAAPSRGEPGRAILRIPPRARLTPRAPRVRSARRPLPLFATPEDSDDPLAPDDRDDRRRHEGVALAQARLRRGREPPGVAQRSRRLRLGGGPQGRGHPARGAGEGPAGLRPRHGGERGRRGRRQDPPLAHRSARRHHQLPARAAAVLHLGRPRARGPDRGGRDLRSRQGRDVPRREGQGRLPEQPAHPRRGPHRHGRRPVQAAACPISGGATMPSSSRRPRP